MSLIFLVLCILRYFGLGPGYCQSYIVESELASLLDHIHHLGSPQCHQHHTAGSLTHVGGDSGISLVAEWGWQHRTHVGSGVSLQLMEAHICRIRTSCFTAFSPFQKLPPWTPAFSILFHAYSGQKNNENSVQLCYLTGVHLWAKPWELRSWETYSCLCYWSNCLCFSETIFFVQELRSHQQAAWALPAAHNAWQLLFIKAVFTGHQLLVR